MDSSEVFLWRREREREGYDVASNQPRECTCMPMEIDRVRQVYWWLDKELVLLRRYFFSYQSGLGFSWVGDLMKEQ